MGKKTKKFIDKKNSITYDIVHRSQKDPLAADVEAPQRVLLPREELINHGIYYDDGYDYSKHLKDTKDLGSDWERIEKKSNLPSSVFASIAEEEVGLLNKAAPISGPRPDLDHEIVAAMDDDFDHDDPENELEDDFITLANAQGSDTESCDDDSGSDVSSGDFGLSDEERDELGSLHGHGFDKEETKSRFTDYSMSSSVISRNDGLTQLDRKFDKMYADYDEIEQGPLDENEIEGFISADDARVLQCVDEFEKKQTEAIDNIAELMKDRLKFLNHTNDSSNDDEDEDLHRIAVEPRGRDKWDCETILSTYSNIYNHPKLLKEPTKHIEQIRIDPRTGIPVNVLDGRPGKLTARGLAQLNLEYDQARGRNTSQSIAETMRSTLSILSIRPKNETPEDRKERKQALKDYRKQRRIERKANSEAFKEEKKRQEKVNINKRRNLQCRRVL
ncbi:hypothetical protein HCN44_000259 [Aphidius gifuensis]|uniref:Protein LTV1 homolog n=1 Tax=Aphidius gifuensis TaxID=684658 RepID=A0A835CPB9_APHGI|nr:protein LTV1 homolog [Aphidius gifuensis]KAF7990454.1 hypothetical protein HCN44_000259 [Aphidius gifuensis]